MKNSLNTPALPFPAIAILTLGYIKRCLGGTNVIRTCKKDYDSGYMHTGLIVKPKILKKRVELARYMISMSRGALMLVCLSMLFIFIAVNDVGVAVFTAAVVAMIAITVFPLYETRLSNNHSLLSYVTFLSRKPSKNN